LFEFLPVFVSLFGHWVTLFPNFVGATADLKDDPDLHLSSPDAALFMAYHEFFTALSDLLSAKEPRHFSTNLDADTKCTCQKVKVQAFRKAVFAILNDKNGSIIDIMMQLVSIRSLPFFIIERVFEVVRLCKSLCRPKEWY
jgi:hypothetical protein